MSKNLNFSSQTLLDKQFKHSEQGYDPLEVDTVLDQIIEDYKELESLVSKNNTLTEQITQLRKEIQSLQTELEKERKRVKYLPKDQKEYHIDNYELLLRVGKLEKIIQENLNISPEDIK